MIFIFLFFIYSNGIILYSKMKEYQEKFIWNKFLEKLRNETVQKNQNITEMIVDSNDEDNIDGNNEEVMPNYNSLYNETFLDDNDMILDD